MRKAISSATAFAVACLVPCVSVYAVDNTKIGYGQGTATDSRNRPTDAISFNDRYSDYSAFAISPDEKRVIITFDQGYENGYTEKILDTLQEKNVKAVFFLTGDYAKKETALVRRMIDEGHIIGNHGMKHASLPTLSEKQAEEEIMSLHNFVLNNYGYQMQYFRCPCGEYSEKALETIQKCGYKTLFWSFAYVDWKTDSQPDPVASKEKLFKSAHGGEILLLHSVSSTNAEILGDVIDNFRKQGFTV
ncbi:MAG: polysaccharide deacetylase family protein [Ruminococcus sp.]|nr:polysaccharide deacetylase family protein [Ruminococcus sp.]